MSFDPAILEDAVERARTSETDWPRDLANGLRSDARVDEPRWGEVLGPTQERGDPNGVVLHRGRTVAEWGEPDRADMTFSVTKSFLAALTGVALGDGLIRSLDDRMGDYALDEGFESEQNRTITWRQLLQQTSEWSGWLWDKPDQVDHFRSIGKVTEKVGTDGGVRKGEPRELAAPGTFWEYNDVRVNRLSLSLMQVFRRPLPEVLADRVMTPLGASNTWAWHAYRNAHFNIDGTDMASVPGGGHWGGGLFISSRDLARVGRLVQSDGLWEGQRILPVGWAAELRRPCPLNPNYGLLWWLNTGFSYVPEAPASSYFMVGAGSNIVWVDDALDVVVVMRWIDRAKLGWIIDGFVSALETVGENLNEESMGAVSHGGI